MKIYNQNTKINFVKKCMALEFLGYFKIFNNYYLEELKIQLK